MASTTTSDVAAAVVSGTPAPGASAPSTDSGKPPASDTVVAAATGAPPTAAEPTKDPAAENKAAASRAALKEQEATRRLNLERQKLADERAKMATESKAREEALIAEYKKDPLGFGAKHGLTYEELTKRAIAEAGKNTPTARVEALEQKLAEKEAAETKAREEAQATQQKQATDAAIAAYVGGIHEHATKGGDAFELLASLDADYAKGLIFDVADLLVIDQQEKRARGEIEKVVTPTAQEVCEKIENYLVAEAVKMAGMKKVRAKLTPAQEEAVKEAAKTDDVPPAVAEAIAAQKKRNPPKALTNKTSAAPTPAGAEPVRTKVAYKDREKLIKQIEEQMRKGA